MKKWTWLLFTVSLAGLLLAGYGLIDGEKWRTLPWSDRELLSNLSGVDGSPDTAIALIGNSKQELSLLSGDGTLRFHRSAARENDGGSEQTVNYTSVVADGQGRSYALATVLDAYGLYVSEERIFQYETDGSAKLLYRLPGDGQSKRVGQIRGLQLKDDSLYFFVLGNERVSLRQIALADGAVNEVAAYEFPSHVFLSELTGTEPGQIYYTTRRGAIYHIDAAGSRTMVYPLPGMAHTRKNFPEFLTLDDRGMLLFVDRLLNAVMEIDPARPESLRTRLSGDMLAIAAPDAESVEALDIGFANGVLTVLLNDRVLQFDGSGALSHSLNDARPSKGERTLTWASWGGAALSLALLLIALRLIYVYVMNRRLSLFIKQLVIIFPVIVVCMIMLSNFIYNSFSARMEEQMRSELALLARNGQHLIDGDSLDKLRSPEQYGSEEYLAVKQKMQFLFGNMDAEERKGLYSTLYKVEDEKLYLILDDDDGVNMFKPFENSEENDDVIRNGTIHIGQWEDADGKWMYAIGPVFNRDGQVVGIYETGRDLRVLEKENELIYQNVIAQIAVITLILLGVIMLLNFLVLASIRKLRRSVMDITGGNWDAEVKIKRRDEIGDLGEQFNRMAYYIRRYIADITSFSEASYRFVPQQFFSALGKKGILDIHLGDQVQRNMSVLVANLRDFRQLSASMSPKEYFDFMNSFLRRFGPIVRDTEGLISKYSGSGFMALFPSQADLAMRAAVALRRELAVYNEERRRSGADAVDVGIAIHKGPLMMGIIGEEMRWEGDVISEDVQRASMLQQVTDTLGCSVLATKVFFEQLRSPELYRHRSLGRIRVEGMDAQMELIDVYESDPEEQRVAKERTKALFERGVTLCQEGRFYDAREVFVEVIKQNRNDKAAKLYFYLCDECYQNGTVPDWNGALAI